MSVLDIDEKTIISIIKKAGQKITQNFRFTREVQEKGFANYVTDLNKTIENYIITEIKQIYPTVNFISEEKEVESFYDSYWVLDPIDGTTNLLHKYKSVCISLAYVAMGEVVFGIVYNPITKELFYAKKGEGAFLETKYKKQKISVNDNHFLENSIIGFGCPYNKKKIPYIMKIMERILIRCDDIKRLGPASLDICYVACGRLSAYVELDLEIWDFLAGSLILEEAGGNICDFTGKKVLNNKTNIIASNPHIINEILSIIKEVKINYL